MTDREHVIGASSRYSLRRVQVRLDRSGKPEVLPPSPGVMILSTLFAGFSAMACAAVLLGLRYRLSRTAPGIASPGESRPGRHRPRWASSR